MIDTIKIYTAIDKKTYDKLKLKCNIKTSYNIEKRLSYYEIITDKLEGSFDSNISVTVDDGHKYGFLYNNVIVIEGSFHKFVKGQNAFDGFYNLQFIVCNLISIAEKKFDVKLPKLKHWFLNRADVSKCYDLKTQDKVCGYINNFRLLNYPRRNLKFYENECVYITGFTSTLKIYNKLLEFRNHDRQKVKNFFDVTDFENKIYGFVRFECEIKKRKLKKIYNKDKFIRVDNVLYSDLEKIWVDEFMKILKFDFSGLSTVRKKDEVMRRLFTIYKQRKATVLYSFYLNLLLDGYKKVKGCTAESTFYRNIKELKSCGVDFSQSANLVYEYDENVEFNPFESIEVV